MKRTEPAASGHPQVGMLVSVRNRRVIVTSVEPYDGKDGRLSLVAFHELKKVGLEAFLALNDGEGWMLLEAVRLADHGLGHDDRARDPQPIRARLCERFLPWQLEQSVEESWEECARHSELIEKIMGPIPERSKRSLDRPSPPGRRGGKVVGGEGGGPLQLDIFDSHGG